MIAIKLPHGIYQYDPEKPLGPRGGFGVVYKGFSEKYGDVAVKHIGFQANREITIASELLSGQFKHVIPMYDAGQDAESGNNYVVMAKAEKSLNDELIQKESFSENEVVSILTQIIEGLLEVPLLSHRDLKPGNILFHDNLWKIADFGIAKFIEDTTSIQTVNDCLTPQYAAPEQWEYKHATNALDIYSLGCVCYSLLTGDPPFQGTKEELRHQHLFYEPPRINGIDGRLTTIIYMMLRKSPETRPSATRILSVLNQISQQRQSTPTINLSSLSQAAATVSEQNAKEEAKKLLEQNEKERREKIAIDAMSNLAEIIGILLTTIHDTAPNSNIQPLINRHNNPAFPQGRVISLGSASLSINFNNFFVIDEGRFKYSGWDVITGATIILNQNPPNSYTWGANLWFTNQKKYHEFRWVEVSYMTSPLMRLQANYQPYAVTDIKNADLAASNITAEIQFGSSPKFIDYEFIDNFCARWGDLFAQAALGQLRHPSRLPID